MMNTTQHDPRQQALDIVERFNDTLGQMQASFAAMQAIFDAEIERSEKALAELRENMSKPET